jgi:hypothetical protein
VSSSRTPSAAARSAAAPRGVTFFAEHRNVLSWRTTNDRNYARLEALANRFRQARWVGRQDSKGASLVVADHRLFFKER